MNMIRTSIFGFHSSRDGVGLGLQQDGASTCLGRENVLNAEDAGQICLVNLGADLRPAVAVFRLI